MKASSGTWTQQATRATWWSAMEIGARYGVQFLVTMVLARLLIPGDFGLMAMLLVFISFATLLAEGGLGTALIQKQDTSPNDETSVFFINLGISVLLTTLLWALAPSIASFFNEPKLTSLLKVLVWLLPLNALATVPNALLSQRLDFRKRAIAEFVASIGSAGLALWLAWQAYGVWSLVAHAVFGTLLRATMLWWLSSWRPRGRFDWQAFTGLFRFGSPLLLANALNITSLRLRSLFIGRLFNAQALGFYTMAQDTQQAPAQFMGSLLNRVGLPMFSVVATQPVKLSGALRLALRLSMFIFAPCMVGIAVVATPLVTVLYGQQWIPVAPILCVLALAATFWPLHVLNLAALSALGRSDLVLRLEIAKTIITIPLVIAACFHSVLAVAWAIFAANLACIWINTWYSYGLLGCGLRTQMLDLLPGFLLTLGSAMTAWLSSKAFDAPMISLGTSVCAAIAVYLIGARVFRVQAGLDLIDFLKNLRSNNRPHGRVPA